MAQIIVFLKSIVAIRDLINTFIALWYDLGDAATQEHINKLNTKNNETAASIEASTTDQQRIDALKGAHANISNLTPN